MSPGAILTSSGHNFGLKMVFLTISLGVVFIFAVKIFYTGMPCKKTRIYLGISAPQIFGFDIIPDHKTKASFVFLLQNIGP